METIPHILRKIQRLAESGVAGERENARRKLAALLARHGLSEADLAADQRQWVNFPIGTAWEQKVLVQVVSVVTGIDTVVFRRVRRLRKLVAVDFELTPAEAADVRAQWRHFQPLLAYERRAMDRRTRALRKQFAHAFIHANTIFPTSLDRGNGTPLPPAQLAALLAAVRGMASQPFTKPCPQLACES